MVSGIAVVELAFDPIARAAGLALRWETLAVAGAVLLALLLAAWIARRTPIDVEADADAGILGPGREDHLRRDDLLFVVLGAVPGAIVGGRLAAGLLHPDFYAANPTAFWDPGQGSIELVGAVLGGALTASIVAALLEAPVSRWFHVGAIPLLVVLALGKAGQALGGSGQGSMADVPWATAYLGPGPWGSLGADVPAHPAQLYEALLTAVALLLVAMLTAAGAFERRDGRAFAVALVLWAIARGTASLSWRDSPILGAANAGTLLAGAALLVGIVLFAVAPRLAGRPQRKVLEDEPGPAWPDPATRPRF